MRAPQYGITAWQRKRRTNNAALPRECAVKGHIMPYRFAHVGGYSTKGYDKPKGLYNPRDSLGAKGRGKSIRAKGSTIALIAPPKHRMRFKHKKHTKVALTLWRNVASPDQNQYNPWSGRFQSAIKGKRMNPKLSVTLIKGYIGKYGSLGGPIITKQAANGTELKATLIADAK